MSRLEIAGRPAWLPDLLTASELVADDAIAALDVADRFGTRLPKYTDTGGRWQALASVAAVDLTVARVLEAHTDALAILDEADSDVDPAGTWGVFAAEGPGVRLDAHPVDSGWVVNGTKPWCSLGGSLQHALVTAHVEGGRRLFALDLGGDGVRADPPSGWVARGLRTLPSGPVHFDDVPATPIGERDWYLRRPGFAWGGLGVAACWFGGALPLYDRLCAKAKGRADDVLFAQLGAVDVALHAARDALAQAAALVDAREDAGDVLALRVRSTVADAVELTLKVVGHAMGPSPLAFDEAYARRVSDLELYVRQHHGERDLASLGRLTAEGA